MQHLNYNTRNFRATQKMSSQGKRDKKKKK